MPSQCGRNRGHRPARSCPHSAYQRRHAAPDLAALEEVPASGQLRHRHELRAGGIENRVGGEVAMGQQPHRIAADADQPLRLEPVSGQMAPDVVVAGADRDDQVPAAQRLRYPDPSVNQLVVKAVPAFPGIDHRRRHVRHQLQFRVRQVDVTAPVEMPAASPRRPRRSATKLPTVPTMRQWSGSYFIATTRTRKSTSRSKSLASSSRAGQPVGRAAAGAFRQAAATTRRTAIGFPAYANALDQRPAEQPQPGGIAPA